MKLFLLLIPWYWRINYGHCGLPPEGMPRAEALRQAKLELKASAKYNHPYYWSPFILIGNDN